MPQQQSIKINNIYNIQAHSAKPPRSEQHLFAHLQSYFNSLNQPTLLFVLSRFQPPLMVTWEPFYILGSTSGSYHVGGKTHK